MQQITVIGTVGKDIEQRSTPNGHKVTQIDLAVNVRKKDETATVWYKVNFWNDHPLLKHIKKGSSICIIGDLEPVSLYESEGKTKVSLSIRGFSIYFLPYKKDDSDKSVVEKPVYKEEVKEKRYTSKYEEASMHDDFMPF